MPTPKPYAQPSCEPLSGIAEVAAHFGITTRAIRFYEDKGLISPRRENGSRVFDLSDKERIKKILRAKRIGFSLDDIKLFMDVIDGEVKSRDELLSRKREFERVIGNLNRKRDDINALIKDMRAMCAAIDQYVKTAPETRVFEFADAYQSAFRNLDENFIPA